MGKSDDRRSHPRHEVLVGNAQITTVRGRGRTPKGRARILNWSRTGMLLRVPSPRRRFVFFSQSPVLQEMDSIACTLRLPPAYNDVDVKGGVVRVERASDEPDAIDVGIKFDLDATPSRQIEAVAKLLEPKHLTAWSQRLPRKTSQRAAKVASQKVARVASERVAKASSQRVAKVASERVAKASSERVARAPGQKAVSQRATAKSQRLPSQRAAAAQG